MYEVEQKACIPHEAVRPALSDLGARFESIVHQRDVYFDHPSRDFTATDEALRVRQERIMEGGENGSDRITYKGPRLETRAKSRIERESPIADSDAVIEILQALDFDKAGVVEKTRERYVTDTSQICLDEVVGLGEFVEIEISADTPDLDTAQTHTEKMLEKVGIPLTDTIQESYLAMILRESTDS